MKIKVPNAIFAILTLTIEMAAKQRAFHNLIAKSLFVTDDGDESAYKQFLEAVNQQAKEESALLRASLLEFAEIDIQDFLNGSFDL